MGLLSSLKKVVQTVAKPIAAAAAVVAQPIKTIQAIISPTKTVAQVQEKFFEQPKATQAAQFAVSAAAIGGGAILGTAGKLGAVAKAVIPATTKGKVIAAVATPVVIGAVTKEPVSTVKTIAKAPSELSQFGSDVATFVTSPSIETGKQVISESPIISAGVGAAVLGAAALKVVPAIATYSQTQAIQEQTEAIKNATSNVLPSSTIPTTEGAKAVAAATPVAPQTPITPATQPLIATAGSKTSTTRKRRASKAANKGISQRVNVIVQTRSSSTGIRATKKYLNREVLAY